MSAKSLCVLHPNEIYCPCRGKSRLPRLLDLFCGAGGATKGYQRAGFYVVGVDIAPQPRYCGDEFVRGDAFDFMSWMAPGNWDAIHASPPCQGYSLALKHLAAPKPLLIDAVRARLGELGRPWVIENVEGAPLATAPTFFGQCGFVLCGTAFGLRVERHRLFESTIPMASSECHHTRHAMNPHNVAGRKRMYAEFGRGDPEKIWAKEMGVEWMNRHEVREAIPPVYTEHIGRELIRVIRAAA